jgi:arylsulfatase A-like enzyme
MDLATGIPSRAARATLTLAAVVVGACSRPSETGTLPVDAPDIVLISIDSLRADHLGCYGYEPPTSPTIDRLAREGARFETALSTTSWTLPAHAALFTGLYDSAHGLVDNGLSLAEEHRTLAEVLRDHGYQTGGFFGGPYLHPVFGLGQGFDTYESCMAALGTQASETTVRDQSKGRTQPSHADVTGPRTVAAVERWLADVRAEEPLFLFVHLWDVHYDYLAPRELVEQFDPGYAGTLTGEGFMENPAVNPGMSPRDYQHLLALYDAEIRFTDDHLDQILELLRRSGRLENALVVVTADHGEEFFEHGQKGHQKSLFDEVVRVPLVIHWPGRVRPGTVIPDQVRLIDLLPTLLTAAGVTQRPAVMGRDLSPLLGGGKLGFEPALLELLVDRREYRAARTNGFKVVRAAPSAAPAGFDLVANPKEALEAQILLPDPRVGSALKVLESETQRARAWLQELGSGPREVTLDPSMIAELRRLGYVHGGKE